MNVIFNTCAALSLILIWVDASPFVWFRSKLGMYGTPSRLITFKDYIQKLINCSMCISFWTGVVLVSLTGVTFYLALPLFIRIIERRLI